MLGVLKAAGYRNTSLRRPAPIPAQVGPSEGLSQPLPRGVDCRGPWLSSPHFSLFLDDQDCEGFTWLTPTARQTVGAQ